jgi:aspartyl/glutamyl-tRNA(Asn/Gln) amidotransferase C subunit
MPNTPPIDDALLGHLEELARISLPKHRQAELRGKLQQLVDAFSTLGDADLDAFGSDPDGRTTTAADLRQDRAETPLNADRVLANSPQTAADCFVVARVIEP